MTQKQVHSSLENSERGGSGEFRTNCKNVVGYIRVSTDAQAAEDKYGIEAQKETIQDYCSKHDMNVLEWYIDEGKSGAKEDRPELDKILYGTEVHNPPIEAVVVAKSDRLARDINIYFFYQHELLKKDIELISVMEDFGVMGPFANIIKAFVITMAEMERDNITKRTSAGRKVKAAQGGYSGGGIPFGYRHGTNGWIVDKENAEYVKKAFDLRAKGMPFQAIADAFNADGIKTQRGEQFVPATIKRIIDKKKTYQGYYKYSGSDWVKGQHEAILPPDEE